MLLHISTEWIWLYIAILMRVGTGFLLFFEIIPFRIPAIIRLHLIMALTLSITIVSGIDAAILQGAKLFELVSLLLSEMLIGLAFGLVIVTFFSVFLFAGRVVDYQSGIGLAGMIDPARGENTPLIGQFLLFMAVAYFIAVNGHVHLYQVLAASYQVIPVGYLMTDIQFIRVIEQFSYVFSMGLMLVAPVVIAILLVDFGMGLLGRSMPQMNVFIISFPIKIMMALMILIMSIPLMRDFLDDIFANMFEAMMIGGN